MKHFHFIAPAKFFPNPIIIPPSFPHNAIFPSIFDNCLPFSLPPHIFQKNKNQMFPHLILISSYILFPGTFPPSSIFTFSRHLFYLLRRTPTFSSGKTARSTKRNQIRHHTWHQKKKYRTARISAETKLCRHKKYKMQDIKSERIFAKRCCPFI